ncbi:hypothetical protein ANO11243_043440 [Dothideomycetidae sp. 11243]|nr:hypothetical protein ANO11243_043440 [fungal sp. No.11243]
MVDKAPESAKPPPGLNVPPSDVTVRVSCIDSTTKVNLDTSSFLEPVYKGADRIVVPAFGFLIEHPSGKKIMFDLATRKDWQNLPPIITKRLEAFGWTVDIEKNIADILTEHGVDVAGGAISEVIWSHHHWDHTGDIGTFPSSTDLVIGPGFKDAFLPGYPEDPEGQVHSSDFRNRTVREISISDKLKLGRFNAHDYFGDGSFYLLDTPGHAIGHMCGLARTTKDTFVLMGGDACHHAGEFRPSPYLPLPNDTTGLAGTTRLCPGHMLLDMHRNKSATEPFYTAAPKFVYDQEKCDSTIEGIEEFDAHKEVLVLIAHDGSVLGDVDMYPKTLNDWYEKGVGKTVRWKFLSIFGAGDS